MLKLLPIHFVLLFSPSPHSLCSPPIPFSLPRCCRAPSPLAFSFSAAPPPYCCAPPSFSSGSQPPLTSAPCSTLAPLPFSHPALPAARSTLQSIASAAKLLHPSPANPPPAHAVDLASPPRGRPRSPWWRSRPPRRWRRVAAARECPCVATEAQNFSDSWQCHFRAFLSIQNSNDPRHRCQNYGQRVHKTTDFFSSKYSKEPVRCHGTTKYLFHEYVKQETCT